MASNNQKIKSRYLAERSYLYYQYPQPTSERSVEFYLPMLENIDVTESQRPNLATYDLLGRAGNLYSYLGAKSREFTLRFNITLPNILDYLTNVELNEQFRSSFRYFYSERDAQLRAFLKYQDKSNKDILDTKRVNYYSRARSKLASFNKSFEPPSKTNFLQGIAEWLNKVGVIPDAVVQSQSHTMMDAVNYLVLWINIIRTSTVNHSSNTSLGCPTIYINHGTMYNNIPCICTNYSINIKNGAGYDLVSLTPRQIEVSLNLSENRTGNFGTFEPYKFIEGENLAGWECVIKDGTMDPNNVTFGEDLMDELEVNLLEQQAKKEQESIEAEMRKVAETIKLNDAESELLSIERGMQEETRLAREAEAGARARAEADIDLNTRGIDGPAKSPGPNLGGIL